MDTNMISIVIPFYKMSNCDFFLKRCLDSIYKQTFQDYEIVVPKHKGGWAKNHNQGIKQAKGEYIKFLHMDDYFFDHNCLQEIVDNFTKDWCIVGCSNNPRPYWTDDIWKGNNKLGGPSCLMVKNDGLLFDESLTWMVDCDYYMKLFKKYGEPTILDEVYIGIGEHKGQATYLIPDEIKIKEFEYMKGKYQ